MTIFIIHTRDPIEGPTMPALLPLPFTDSFVRHSVHKQTAKATGGKCMAFKRILQLTKSDEALIKFQDNSRVYDAKLKRYVNGPLVECSGVVDPATQIITKVVSSATDSEGNPAGFVVESFEPLE